jgi:DNA replication licensing factor MCM5
MKVATTGQGELSAAAMKKYIQYCKAKCIPRLSEEAGDVLTSSYVKIRDEVRKNAIAGNSQNNNNSSSSANADTQPVIPITVRQLEALVRISESLAKMRIDSVVRTVDVTEALRLFKVSTMAASTIDQQNQNTNQHMMVSSAGNAAPGYNRDEMDRTESFLRSRLVVGGNLLNRLKLIEEGVSQGYNAINIAKCISVMASRGEILERNQGRLIKRIK